MNNRYIKLGVLTALALALSWAERFIPSSGVVPGGKLGFANIITIIVLSMYGLRAGFAVTTVRCLLAATLYGGIMSLPYSLGGGMAALLVMYALSKLKGITTVGIAVGGAFAHNLAQVCIACIMLGNIHILSYFKVLGFLSVIAGVFTGICSGMCLDRLAIIGMGSRKRRRNKNGA